MTYILYIMTNDTKRHVAKVVEDMQYFQDVREFFNGGLVWMKRHPMWFLFDLDDVPYGFDDTFVSYEINGYPEEDAYADSKWPPRFLCPHP